MRNDTREAIWKAVERAVIYDSFVTPKDFMFEVEECWQQAARDIGTQAKWAFDQLRKVRR